MTDQVSERISEYLQAGGLFNPEAMDHDKVRDLLIECRGNIDALAAKNAKLRDAAKLVLSEHDDPERRKHFTLNGEMTVWENLRTALADKERTEDTEL